MRAETVLAIGYGALALNMVLIVANGVLLMRQRRGLKRADVLIASLETHLSEAKSILVDAAPGLTIDHNIEMRAIDENTFAMMGYPIRIRRTAIGKPWRVEQEGRPEQGFDSQGSAMMECLQRAFEIDQFEGAKRE